MTRKRSEDSDDEILTKAERRKLKKRYEEIRNKEKEEQKIKDAYMNVKNFDKSRKIKKAAQQALKKIDKILDDSSTDDRKKRRTRKSEGSNSDQSRTEKYRVKAFRVRDIRRGESEARPVLTERGEDETETQEVNPVMTRTPPNQSETPRKSESLPEAELEVDIQKVIPNVSEEDTRRFQENTRNE